MRCFAVSVGSVLGDSIFSLVLFDITGTLKQNVGATLPALAAPPPKSRLDELRKFGVLAADRVGRRSCREEAIAIRIQSKRS